MLSERVMLASCSPLQTLLGVLRTNAIHLYTFCYTVFKIPVSVNWT